MRGIHIKAGVRGAAPEAAPGAAPGAEVDEADEVDEMDEVTRTRERIWDVRNGGIAVPLPPFLLTTN